MTVTSAPIPSIRHIRRLDVRQDLFAVADLIEMCFVDTMDADGRVYLSQLRRAAREAAWLRWIPGVPDVPVISLSGYVWIENDSIVGNLSLIPLVKDHRRVYLIANVAVNPAFRRRGIARALTEAAMQDIRDRNGPEAWLQVRKENSVAYELYSSLGFQERAVRSTWIAQPGRLTKPIISSNEWLSSRRLAEDWYWQQQWLLASYPPEVIWNLPLRPANFKPGLLYSIDRWMSGKRIRHWTARHNNELAGMLTWEAMPGIYDYVWLAARPGEEAEMLQFLAPQALSELPRRKPVILNYATGKADTALPAAGFHLQQVLIWMQAF